MSIAELITKYWGIIMFFAGLVFHALWTYFKVDNHERRIKDMEKKQDDFAKLTASIENKISAIDAKLDILLEGYKRDK
jgi:hypothetical protein